MSEDSRGSGIWKTESAEGTLRPLRQVVEFGVRLLGSVGLLSHENLKAWAGS